jgi:hypothetical protein
MSITAQLGPGVPLDAVLFEWVDALCIVRVSPGQSNVWWSCPGACGPGAWGGVGGHLVMHALLENICAPSVVSRNVSEISCLGRQNLWHVSLRAASVTR